MFNFFVYFVSISIFKLFTDLIFVTESLIDYSLPLESNYDFIVGESRVLFSIQKYSKIHFIFSSLTVGSGSAGGEIATNLKGRVLLIEAGGYGSGVIFNVPIIQPLLLRSKYDWQHETVPQKEACKAMNDNRCFWPSGKIISGSHRLNNMIYYRGFESDYEEIVNKTMAAQLFDEVEKYIPVSETNFKSKLSHAFISGAQLLGFDNFDYTKLTQLYGKRYTQFYNWERTKKRPETVLNALVTSIVFEGKQAVGIDFVKYGTHRRVYGDKIVLAAGTMGSSKILLHSGVGPKKHLDEIGINVVENLPVGENLQDHVTTSIDLLLNQNIGCSIADIYNPLKVAKYFWNGNGPLSIGGSESMGFVSLNASATTPDLSFILMSSAITYDYGIHLRKIINLREDVWENYYQRLGGQSIATILPILLHPKSIGNIRLKSKNFNDPLLIDPKYYQSKEDIDVMIKAIRIVQKLIETAPMKELGSELIPKSLPGCEKLTFDTNDYWECYIRHLTLTMFHPVGTCKMGEYDDTTTVVLKNFRVKNLENLFVVDGSVIPKAPSSNPHALISMLAQKFVHDMNMMINNES
jgi:choline dehydrogenase